MVGLFSASTAFLLRQVVLYDVTNLCEDGPLRLSCSFDVLLLFVELIFAILSLLLSMLACCYNSRTLGLLGFSGALFPAFLNFAYLLAYVSSDFYASLAPSLSQPVIADKLQACTFWVTLSIGFFSLHVAPDLFQGDVTTLPVLESPSPRKPTVVKEEKKELEEDQEEEEEFEVQVSRELGPQKEQRPQNGGQRRGSVIKEETPRSQRELLGNRSPLAVRQFLHSGTTTRLNKQHTPFKQSQTVLRSKGTSHRWVG